MKTFLIETALRAIRTSLVCFLLISALMVRQLNVVYDWSDHDAGHVLPPSGYIVQ